MKRARRARDGRASGGGGLRAPLPLEAPGQELQHARLGRGQAGAPGLPVEPGLECVDERPVIARFYNTVFIHRK